MLSSKVGLRTRWPSYKTDKVVTRSYYYQQLDRTTSQNVLSTIAVRQLRSQYDHLVFGTIALRLISGRDGFYTFLSRFKIFRGHLDQSRPNSSNKVRKQISIGCYYDHSVFTPFKPVRFELLGRTVDEYKCNRGINNNWLVKICDRRTR